MLIDQLQLLTFCLFEQNDVIELRSLPAEGGVPTSTWHHASMLPAVCEVIEQNNKTHNCYFGCNPRKAIGQRNSDGVRLARSLCVEWDETTWREAWCRIKAARLPEPTLVIWSGSGPHCYWRLSRSIRSMGQWSVYQKALIRLLGSDRCIHDAPRIMRLPGTWNHRRIQYAKVLQADPGARYSVDDLLYRMRVVEQSTVQPVKQKRIYSLMDRYIRAEKYLAKCEPAISGQGGHSVTFRVVRSIVWGFGIVGDEALSILQSWNQRCDPPWSDRDLRHKIREAETKSFRKPKGYLAA